MAQNELDYYESIDESALQVIQEPKDPSTTDTGDGTIEEEHPVVQKPSPPNRNEGEIQLMWLLREPEEEIQPEAPPKGRKLGYVSKMSKDFYVLSSPKRPPIRKDNIRKQFIRGFRTAVAEVITPSVTHRKNLHSFDPLDQYRRAKWKELQMRIDENPDLEMVTRQGQSETGAFASFDNAFLKAILEVQGAVEAFKVYVQLVFGECEEGLEERLKIGVRVQADYEKKGYWERLRDYISTMMISELAPTS